MFKYWFFDHFDLRQEQHPDRLRRRPGAGHCRGQRLRPAAAGSEDAGRAQGGGEGGAGDGWGMWVMGVGGWDGVGLGEESIFFWGIVFLLNFEIWWRLMTNLGLEDLL